MEKILTNDKLAEVSKEELDNLPVKESPASEIPEFKFKGMNTTSDHSGLTHNQINEKAGELLQSQGFATVLEDTDDEHVRKFSNDEWSDYTKNNVSGAWRAIKRWFGDLVDKLEKDVLERALEHFEKSTKDDSKENPATAHNRISFLLHNVLEEIIDRTYKLRDIYPDYDDNEMVMQDDCYRPKSLFGKKKE